MVRLSSYYGNLTYTAPDDLRWLWTSIVTSPNATEILRDKLRQHSSVRVTVPALSQ